MSLASDTVKRFIRLYSDGTPETYGSDAFLEVFSPNVDWAVAPSNGHPAGLRGNREVLRKDLELNASYLRNRNIHLLEIVEQGNKVAWTGRYTAIVAREGLPLPKGSELAVELAVFSDVVNGLIVKQREYPTLAISSGT